MCHFANFLRWIERARVYVSCLHADNRRPVNSGQQIHTHPSLRVSWHPHNSVSSEPKHAQRLYCADMNFLAPDHCDLRRSDQPIRLDVPSCALEYGVSCRSQRSEIRHCRAGHKTDSAFWWQSEKFEKPLRRNL